MLEALPGRFDKSVVPVFGVANGIRELLRWVARLGNLDSQCE